MVCKNREQIRNITIVSTYIGLHWDILGYPLLKDLIKSKLIRVVKFSGLDEVS